MSFKGSKIQPTRSATLAVQSVDSVDDNASVSSTNLPGLSYRPQVPVDDIFNSPSLPRRKRRQTYAAPNNNNSSSGGSSGQSAGIAANPHAKYARTLGNVSDAQSQTTLLAPPKLKHRAKSFSAGDRLLADDGGSSSNNNARQAHAQLQRRPSAGGHANSSGQTLSRANSRSSLSARKKRVTWRSPLVDDRLDSEASVKFARAYSGAGPSFFGRSASQSRLAVGDDLSSSSVDDNNSTGSAGSSGGRHKKRSKRHSGSSGGAAGGKRSWLSWLNVFRLFPSRTARPSAAESSAKAAAYSADSSTSSASSGGGAGSAAGGESKQATDDSVVDFSLSLVQLETKLGAAALQPAPLPSSDGSGKPRTARSSLLFLAWRQALNTAPANGGGSGKVRPF